MMGKKICATLRNPGTNLNAVDLIEWLSSPLARSQTLLDSPHDILWKLINRSIFNLPSL
jgi:hypothetical protein